MVCLGEGKMEKTERGNTLLRRLQASVFFARPAGAGRCGARPQRKRRPGRWMDGIMDGSDVWCIERLSKREWRGRSIDALMNAEPFSVQAERRWASG